MLKSVYLSGDSILRTPLVKPLSLSDGGATPGEAVMKLPVITQAQHARKML